MNKIIKIKNLIILALALLCVGLWYLAAFTHTKSETTTNIQSSAAPEYNWRLVTTWPKGFPGLGTAPENFARLVKEMSAGRINIKVLGAGEIVGALEVFDAVSSGSAEMGHSAAYYWKGKLPAAQFFTSVPFGMNAQEFNAWLHYGGGMELWRELYEPFNLVPFAGGNTGVQMGGWYNKEINSIEDLQGLKIRMPGLGGDVINRAGGSAVNIPGGELYTSLKTGVIDATEWVGPYNDLAFGFHQVAKYYYYPGFHEPGAGLEFIVNKPIYDALPEDLQRIIEVAARAVNQDMLDEYTARNNTSLESLVNDHGVELRKMPDEVFAYLRDLSDEVYRDNAQRDAKFDRVWRAYQAFQASVSNYHEISEEAYYQQRRQGE